MRLMQVHEPIRAVRCSYEHIPEAFTWRARQHRVWKIETFHDERLEQLGGVTHRRIFKLQTHTGLRCSISYDAQRGRWRMESIHP
jgi:hypothetical protein